jgi:hypothetical protein
MLIARPVALAWTPPATSPAAPPPAACYEAASSVLAVSTAPPALAP